MGFGDGGRRAAGAQLGDPGRHREVVDLREGPGAQCGMTWLRMTESSRARVVAYNPPELRRDMAFLMPELITSINCRRS